MRCLSFAFFALPVRCLSFALRGGPDPPVRYLRIRSAWSTVAAGAAAPRTDWGIAVAPHETTICSP